MSQVQTENRANYLWVKLTGELVLSQSNDVKEQVRSHLMNAGENVIIDMSAVDFIDSSGLGVLIAWFKTVNQHQGQIIFVGVSQYVQRIIHLAKLDKILTQTATIEEAEQLL